MKTESVVWSICYFCSPALESCPCIGCKTKALNWRTSWQWSQQNKSRMGDYSLLSKTQLLSGSSLYFSFSGQILRVFKAVAVPSPCCLFTISPLPCPRVADETKGDERLRAGWGYWIVFIWLDWNFIYFYTYSKKQLHTFRAVSQIRTLKISYSFSL